MSRRAGTDGPGDGAPPRAAPRGAAPWRAVVLVHEGLDAGLELEPVPAADPRLPATAARHRGGADVVVAAPADRAGLEWALALADEVVALTVAPPRAAALLAWALARGAHRAIRVWDDALAGADLAATARVVAAAAGQLEPGLVVAGERGLAGAGGMLPALVAAHLGWAWLDGAVRLGRDGDGVLAERRLARGRREEVLLPCPAVVGVAAGSAEPRYVSVRARRAAAGRGHEVWGLDALGLDPGALAAWTRLRVVRVDWPRPRPRRTATPGPAGSAAERLRQLLGGSATPAADAGRRRVEGEPAAVADRILAFLVQNGFA